MKKKWILAAVTGLVLAGTVVLIEAWTGDRSAAAAVEGSPRATVHSGQRGMIELVFQVEDCADAQAHLQSIHRRAHSRGFDVRGVVLGRPGFFSVPRHPTELSETFPFPLRTERRARTTRLLRSMGFRRTPVILVFDRSGRLRAALPSGEGTAPLTPVQVVDHVEAVLDASL